jgi:hypothetical protein
MLHEISEERRSVAHGRFAGSGLARVNETVTKSEVVYGELAELKSTPVYV